MQILTIDLMRLKGYLSYRQRQAAVSIGIHENTLYRKLRNETKFYLDELNNLAVFCGCDTIDFLREVEMERRNDDGD